MKKIFCKDHWIILIIIMVTIAAGAVFSWRTARTADRHMRDEFLTQANLVGNSINWRSIRDLTASSADLNSLEYQRLKEQLTLVRYANPLYRFIYLMGQKSDGTIFFFIDSEPPDSLQNYSPPGQVYEEASPIVRNIFAKGKNLTEGPSSDRWGTWISAMVPLRDPYTEKLLAVLGMDIDARDWNGNVFKATLIPISITLLIIIIEAFFFILQREKHENQRLVASEKTLIQSETELQAILQSTADGIIAIDRDGKRLLANNRYLELWKIPADLLSPGSEKALLDYTLNQLKDPEEFLNKVQYLKGTTDEDFGTLYFKDGRVFERFSCPFKQKDELFGRVWSFRDCTERLRIEDELLAAKEKAEESDRLKSAFLANMSHEIRTPMNGILGFAGLLKESNLTGNEQLEYIRIIEKSGARMLNIIHDIVDISKIESGQSGISILETNINEQIETIYTFFKHDVEGKGMQLLVKNTLPSKESIIKTDHEKIYAILTNLVKNAVKYTNEGSIEFGYEKKGNYFEFFVKDTGIGIAKDRQEAIFERFIQADIYDEQALQGAGLGLSISKAYVEMLGGKIWVESEQGKGSIFYFTIPYIAETQAKILIKDVSSGIGTDNQIKNLKILIAEDDETSELFLSLAVKKYSKEVFKARTGIETVEACRNNPGIDLILMDIRMPDMNGYEATNQIRQFNKDVIIIAQSAYGLSGDREKAIEAGCNDYISKPVIKNELLAMIHQYF